jgi:predicted transposase YbfD/YdcC
VLARLRPAAVRTWFRVGRMAVQERRGGPRANHLVAIDGKVVRHRVDRAIDRGPLHRVRAWAPAAPLVVGPVAVAQTRHAIPASPALRQRLERSGGGVTIDARGTPPEMAQTMRGQDADDGLALKGHPGMVHEEVARLFEWANAQPDRDLGHQTDEPHNAGHGREERRRTTVPTARTGLRGSEAWGGLQTVALVEAWRPQGAAGSYARGDDSSRRGLEAQPMAERLRGHGALETALHWGLDLAVREDDSRMRTGHAPDNFAMRRQIARNRLTPEQTNRHGRKVKSHRAGWDHDDLVTVLGI